MRREDEKLEAEPKVWYVTSNRLQDNRIITKAVFFGLKFDERNFRHSSAWKYFIKHEKEKHRRPGFTLKEYGELWRKVDPKVR